MKSYQAAKEDSFWAKDDAPACEECLFPLRVSSEDESASARLTSRCLDGCSRIFCVDLYNRFSNILFERTELCSAVDKSAEAEEPGRLAPQWALAGQTLPIEFVWTRGISNRQSAGDLFTTGRNVVCDGPRRCLSACLGASTSGW